MCAGFVRVRPSAGSKGQVSAHKPRTNCEASPLNCAPRAITLELLGVLMGGIAASWSCTICSRSSQSLNSLHKWCSWCQFPNERSLWGRESHRVTAVITADRKWLCLSGASVGDDIIGICLGLFLSLLFTCAVERKLMSVLMS